MKSSVIFALTIGISLLVLILLGLASGLSVSSLPVALETLQPTNKTPLKLSKQEEIAPLETPLPTALENITLVPASAHKQIQHPSHLPTAAAMGVATTTQQQTSFSNTLREVLVPRIIEGIQFLPGSQQLTPESTVKLDEVATLLRHKTEWHIDVGGHSDNQGLSSNNMQLSYIRAEVVSNYLTLRGINPSRLSTRGYGATKPIADNKTEEGRYHNRRVELGIRKHLIY